MQYIYLLIVRNFFSDYLPILGYTTQRENISFARAIKKKEYCQFDTVLIDIGNHFSLILIQLPPTISNVR